jgi:hypothetical protein
MSWLLGCRGIGVVRSRYRLGQAFPCRQAEIHGAHRFRRDRFQVNEGRCQLALGEMVSLTHDDIELLTATIH